MFANDHRFLVADTNLNKYYIVVTESVSNSYSQLETVQVHSCCIRDLRSRLGSRQGNDGEGLKSAII